MAFQGDSIFWVEVGKIVANPFQPRKEFNEDKLKELAESIRMYGILQPLTVTRKEIQEESGAFHTEYELIAGERRLRASKIAGLEQVPVIIRSGEDTEQEKLELAIIENLQREDLNAVDRALAFKQLADVFKLSHAEVAKKVGRSRMYVSNTIRLLGLPDCILNSVALGDISEGHARTLLMLKDKPEEQDVVYREILLKKLSVREVERIARKIASDKVRKKEWKGTDAHLIAIEKEFTNTLGTRVQIAKTEFGGKVTIDYFSDEDLQKLLSLIKSQESKQEHISEEESDDSMTDIQEPQTVIHEMSPEATVLAKVADATPLEMVQSQTEDIPSEARQEKEVLYETQPEEQENTTQSDDIGSYALNTDEVSDTIDVMEQVTTVTDTSAMQVDAQTQVTPETHNTEDTQTQQPVDLESDEFAFVNQHPEEARKEDLVQPSDFEEMMFTNTQSVSEALDAISVPPTPEEVSTKKALEELAEAVAGPTQENQTGNTSEKKDSNEDDGQLYSLKNFSL